MGKLSNKPPQSIYKNAMPFYKSRIDLSIADAKGKEFADMFLFNLLSSELDILVDSTDASQKKFQHLYFQTRNIERISGQKTFGFGYPLFLFSDNQKLVVAPLFIWSLNLEPDPYNSRQWRIRHTDSPQVEVNRHFLSVLENKFSKGVMNELNEHLKNNKIIEDKIAKFTKTLLTNSNISEYGSNETCIPTPSIDVISALPSEGGLQWSGVFGIYPPQTGISYQENEIATPSLNIGNNLKNENIHPFGLLKLDPNQAYAFDTIRANSVSVIDGKERSGKAHLLTYLLSNILSNGQRCLVVSENVETLKRAQTGLTKNGFFKYHFLLKDNRHDKKNFLEVLRSAGNISKEKSQFKDVDFNVKIGKASRLYDELSKQYKTIKEPVYGKYNRTELIGFYLRSKRNAGHELLHSKLKSADFEFQPTEHEQIKNGILTAHVLYEKVNTLEHPLKSLHSHIFIERDYENASNFIEQRSHYFIDKLDALHKEYIKIQNLFTTRLKDFYELYARGFAFRIKGIREKTIDNTALFGTNFTKSGTGRLRVQGIFSAKKKRVLQERLEIKEEYESLKMAFIERSYFDFTFDDNADFSIERMLRYLDNFETALNNWKTTIPTIIIEEQNRVNSKNVLSNLKLTRDLAMIEEKHDALHEEINSTNLFDEKLENKMLTLPMRQKRIEQVRTQLETTLYNMRDFQSFHKWQKNWLSQSQLSQKVIRALAKVKAQDWTAAFDTWYFHQSIERYFDENMPSTTEQLFEFVKLEQEIQSQLFQQTVALRDEIITESIKIQRRKNKKIHDTFFSKSGNKKVQKYSLNELFHEATDTISSVFPVLFSSVSSALEITQNSDEVFDYIIFLEANLLHINEVSSILDSGKRNVFFKSPTQQSSLSLANYLIENGAPCVNLKGSYSPSANTIPFHSKINIIQSKGFFKEKEGINEIELRKVERLLFSIKPDNKRTFPAIGIVTFTIAQRNAIATRLLQIKQKGSERAEKVKQLERNGLGVFYIEEALGQEFDELIISLTFGAIGQSGRPTKKLKYFSTPIGLQAVQYLIQKSFKPMYLVSSFSDEIINLLLEVHDEEGKFLLGHLLKYVKAISQKEYIQAELHYAFLWEEESKTTAESVFNQEVRRILQTFFIQGRLSRYLQKGELNIPLAVSPLTDDKQTYWLQPDIFISDMPVTSFAWEVAQHELLMKQNVKYMPMFSVAWWKNSELAASKLAAKIIKDNEVN